MTGDSPGSRTCRSLQQPGEREGDLKQYKAAIADYDEALHWKADAAEAYYNRGNAKADFEAV